MKIEDVKVGGIVILNSGGPAMTIYKIEGETVFVTWITDQGVEKANFPVVCVRK